MGIPNRTWTFLMLTLVSFFIQLPQMEFLPLCFLGGGVSFGGVLDVATKVATTKGLHSSRAIFLGGGAVAGGAAAIMSFGEEESREYVPPHVKRMLSSSSPPQKQPQRPWHGTKKSFKAHRLFSPRSQNSLTK